MLEDKKGEPTSAMKILVLCGLVASLSSTWGQTVTENDWNSWLSEVGMKDRDTYNNLVAETAQSLNMESTELHESLVSSFSSVEGAPNPVSLLIQLREELQLVTELEHERDAEEVDTESKYIAVESSDGGRGGAGMNGEEEREERGTGGFDSDGQAILEEDNTEGIEVEPQVTDGVGVGTDNAPEVHDFLRELDAIISQGLDDGVFQRVGGPLPPLLPTE